MTDPAPHSPVPQSFDPEEADRLEEARNIRADLLAALVFIALGALILYASWTMPRLEVRRVHPLTVPGLVPGMLSVALIICGALLGMRAIRQPANGGWEALWRAMTSAGAQRAVAVAVLVFVYTLGLVGAMPFWAATMVFVTAFILVFEVWLAEPRKKLLESLPWALGLAIFAGIAVTLVFERLFLVRLP